MDMRRYWSCISPLNLLNFVLLAIRSRWAFMVAWVWVPLLMDYARPHASAGEVLQGVLGYVHEHGPLSWQSAVNLLCRELPPRRLVIIDFTVWMRTHQDDYRSETA
eukprot:7326467-Pyramimonas_sp.AAC.1